MVKLNKNKQTIVHYIIWLINTELLFSKGMLNASFTPSDYGDFFRDFFCYDSALAYLFVFGIRFD